MPGGDGIRTHHARLGRGLGGKGGKGVCLNKSLSPAKFPFVLSLSKQNGSVDVALRHAQGER
jgi:hypothetical protein